MTRRLGAVGRALHGVAIGCEETSAVTVGFGTPGTRGVPDFVARVTNGSLPLLVLQDYTLSGQRWVLQGLQVDSGAVGGVSFSRPLEVIFGGY